MKHTLPYLLLTLGCSTIATHNTGKEAAVARGPFTEVPAIEMPTGDTSIPIDLLRAVADALLKLPGAKVCDPVTRRPIVGLTTEYCATVYVAGDSNSLSWRVTEPRAGSHNNCRPPLVIDDSDYQPSQVWVVGYVHNHPCGTPPSSNDLRVWPTDAFDPYVAMAEVRLIPGNPVPAAYRGTAIDLASALVAERQDGKRVFLRYFPTGEIQQWSDNSAAWVTLGNCRPLGGKHPPQCDRPLEFLRD